tara:strand:- start:347 stop:1117 length:771 start_codon:yes stop_codon:yes gene_type:complete
MKISIIMQSYLADYPGSRTEPESKFLRAVYSVISQTARNWELVIISDGCTITESLYKKYFSDYSNIIFERLDRHAGSFMQKDDASVKYRIPGSPWGRGVELSTGDWITYFGSDDFLLRGAISTLSSSIELLEKKNPDIRYIINKNRIEHISWDVSNIDQYEKMGDAFKINGLPSIWQNVKSSNSITLSNSMLLHKRGFPETLWSDDGDYKVPRDTLFFAKIIQNNEQHKYTAKIHNPFYVRCHTRPGDVTSNGWDY